MLPCVSVDLKVIAAVLLPRYCGRCAPTAAAAQSTPAAPTKVVFSLDFIPLGRHAPWYAALAEGYYKDEGPRRLHHSRPGHRAGHSGGGIGHGKYRLCRRSERRDRARQRLEDQNGRGELPEGALRRSSALPTAPMSPSRSSSKASISAAAPAVSRRKSSRASWRRRGSIRASSRSAMSRRRRARSTLAVGTNPGDRILRDGEAWP